MKNRYESIFWGILLLAGGGLALAERQGLLNLNKPDFWMIGFAALALVFFVRYVLSGLRSWGRLFPVTIFLSLAGMIWMGTYGSWDVRIITPFFAAITLPFLVAFAIDFRKNWWALIPALVMGLCASVIFFAGHVAPEFIGASFVFAIGIPFLVVFFVNRKNWWALIPGLILTVCGVAILLTDRVPSDFIGAAFMFAIAVPFIVVYFQDRKNWWALIPSFTMFALGLLVLVSAISSQWMGALVTLILSVPFFYVYFRNEQHWWAIIPAGIFASIAVNALLTMPVLGRFADSSLPTGIMFLGWAATFYWLWRQRSKQPTEWARYPAVVASIVATVLIVIGSLTELGLVAVLIAGGALLIYIGLRPHKEKPVA